MNHGWQSESTDGPRGGWSCVFRVAAVVTSPTTARCIYLSESIHLSICLSASLKTKQFCETSSIFEVDNIKIEAILRDKSPAPATQHPICRHLQSCWLTPTLQSCWLTCLSPLHHRLHQQFQDIGSPNFGLQIPVTCGSAIETPSKTKQFCETCLLNLTTSKTPRFYKISSMF